MTTGTTEERVKRIVAKQLEVDQDKIRLEDAFREDLRADSLDAVELIMAFEEEFKSEMRGMEIPEAEAEALTTVKAVVEYIKEKSKKPSVKDLVKRFEEKSKS